jgi:hypothetical protein
MFGRRERAPDAEKRHFLTFSPTTQSKAAAGFFFTYKLSSSLVSLNLWEAMQIYNTLFARP